MKRLWLLLVVMLLGAAAHAQQRVHVTKKGETLFKIASQEYGNGWLWPEIYRANPGIKDPDRIFAGQKIVIPEIPKKEVESFFRKIDSLLRESKKNKEALQSLISSVSSWQKQYRQEYYWDMGSLRRQVSRLERRIEKIESTTTSSFVSTRLSTTRLRVWVDGAWCLSQHPAGYGAREIGAGVEIGRVSIYSGTPALGGLARAKMRLPGLGFAGVEASPLIWGGFRSIRLNVGRDLEREPSLISDARPMAGIGLSLVFQSAKIKARLDWYGWANDIKNPEFWDPAPFRRLDLSLRARVAPDMILFGQSFAQKGFFPEWQIIALWDIRGGYNLGLGYGQQNPYLEASPRGMIVFRAEYTW